MGKVILITGATSGLGAALAQHLLNKGHVVYGTSRKESGEKEGIHILKMDVGDRSAVLAGVASIIESHGAIDVLINNAGLGIAAPTEEINFEELEMVFKTNIYGVLNMVHAVLPHMRSKKSGHIINISSIGSEIGLPFRGLYCASKAAVDKITEGLRLEMRKFKIGVTSIQAGDIQTNINTNRVRPTELSETYREDFERSYAVINEEVNHGVHPRVFGPVVDKIMNTKNPKRCYRVGKPLQRWAPVLKRLLPTALFDSVLMKDYE